MFFYLNVIGVEFSTWQAVEGAEIQSTGEDSIRTATLPATEHRNIYCALYFLFNDYILFLTITTTINCINITMVPNTLFLYAMLFDEIFRVKKIQQKKSEILRFTIRNNSVPPFA